MHGNSNIKLLCVCYRRTFHLKKAERVETPTARRVSTQPHSGASVSVFSAAPLCSVEHGSELLLTIPAMTS